MKKNTHLFLLYTAVSLLIASCAKDKTASREYQTEFVIVIVMDGARYSETWGDPSHANIPYLTDELAPTGVINTLFYNKGTTSTIPGHCAITTGRYQNIDNGGAELPEYPSIFQYWNSTYNAEPSKSWIIASKGKLEVLKDCLHPDWNGEHQPMADCGIGSMGVGSGYRHDSLTFETAMSILSSDHPNLSIINFREPDYSGHLNSWNDYILGIRTIDEYIYQLLEFIESDPIYAGKTTVFVTNDHGRHLDTAASGFSSHGDDCDGCQHILFYAYGPDFKKNEIVAVQRDMIDIPATIAELLHFNMPTGKGNVMFELFN